MSPVYEFHCQACGFGFEKLCRMEQRDFISCEKCGAKATPKISVVNATFGWRLTDRSHEIGAPKEQMERNI